MPSNFNFLSAEWPALHEAAAKAETYALTDARTACFHARRTLELAVSWLYQNDATLSLPYQDNLSALIHEPTFKTTAGTAVFNKAVLITRLGNQAVHSHRAVTQFDAVTGVRELFHVCFWLARTYARAAKPADSLAFNPLLLRKTTEVSPQTQEQLQTLAAQLAEKDTKLSALFADKETLSQQLETARREIAEIKKKNAATPDEHNYSEAETRDYFIDLLLKEAGWALTETRDREFEVAGMPNKEGKGFVDYVLWGDDGIPLALVEAKRTRRDARVGQRQAELYADCLEKQFGRRPIIFYSNGYEHWIWNDAMHPPRPVQGFYKKAELELLIQRRATRKPLAEGRINAAIVERYYQTRAIRRIGEAFEKDGDRKALVVMATGAGKTRTVIALCDVLMRCNWVKRVLFLADRVALVNQAANAFKKHLPEASPVNLVTEKETEGRVFISTYPTMMGLIDETSDGQRRFGNGHFDLVIIDEAHRSVYQKYRAIFDYFDSLLVGLTATPKEEVDRNTYGLFELEDGVPTDAYDIKDAVADKFLVPPKAVSVPLKFQRDGIRYDDLSEEEKEEWDELEWDEEGGVPDRVEAAVVNKWLFNQDTVDKVLAHVMTCGIKVAGGDRLGKTIVFAKNHDHAQFIQERFDANYPKLAGKFARVIDFQTEYAQSLIDNFSQPTKDPHIAISVDMLDTGIDVPEVVNLVFFKIVRSKTKFWQMVGRGTRLSPNLFGPGQDKTHFQIFDYCQNLEFFSANPETIDGASAASLGKRLFTTRLELIAELDLPPAVGMSEAADDRPVDRELRDDVASLLQGQVAAMNLENFVVRSRRRLVEKYRTADAWRRMGVEERGELARDVAGLPDELDPENEEAKRFDLLMLNLQLAVLRKERAFLRLRDQLRSIAGLLEEKSAIPMVAAQLPVILEIQTDPWWEHVTVSIIERTRCKLRDLVQLIEKQRRKPLFTNFEDQIGDGAAVAFDEFIAPDSFERFRTKTRQFLLQHENNLTIQKIRMNEPLTAADLVEIERMLVENGVGSAELIAEAKQKAKGLGRFVRSLIGLDREAAKKALGAFLVKKTLGSNQIEFINLIVEQLTRHGVMSAALLYESPFTDVTPQGPESIFSSLEIDQIVAALEQINARAAV